MSTITQHDTHYSIMVNGRFRDSILDMVNDTFMYGGIMPTLTLVKRDGKSIFYHCTDVRVISFVVPYDVNISDGYYDIRVLRYLLFGGYSEVHKYKGLRVYENKISSLSYSIRNNIIHNGISDDDMNYILNHEQYDRLYVSPLLQNLLDSPLGYLAHNSDMMIFPILDVKSMCLCGIVFNCSGFYAIVYCGNCNMSDCVIPNVDISPVIRHLLKVGFKSGDVYFWYEPSKCKFRVSLVSKRFVLYSSSIQRINMVSIIPYRLDIVIEVHVCKDRINQFRDLYMVKGDYLYKHLIKGGNFVCSILTPDHSLNLEVVLGHTKPSVCGIGNDTYNFCYKDLNLFYRSIYDMESVSKISDSITMAIYDGNLLYNGNHGDRGILLVLSKPLRYLSYLPK